jgi:putative transposase
MARPRRTTPPGVIFHVLNRGSRKGPLFETDGDYHAFEALLVEGVGRFDVQLFAYSQMPNHWHFVVMPLESRALSHFMHWLETTHARGWRVHTGTSGQGAVYQDRFKAIPVESGRHLLWVIRYVERNACRASLVDRAEDWRWCSLWHRENHPDTPWLSPWPVPRPVDWLEHVNRPQTEGELAAFRRLAQRGEPFGGPEWRTQVLADMGLRPRRDRGRKPGELSAIK